MRKRKIFESTCEICSVATISNRKNSRWCLECVPSNKYKGIAHQFKLNKSMHDKLLERSNGVCEICSKPESTLKTKNARYELSVDHNHDTNQVRGLLCRKCNLLVGHIESFIKHTDLQTLLSWIYESHDFIETIVPQHKTVPAWSGVNLENLAQRKREKMQRYWASSREIRSSWRHSPETIEKMQLSKRKRDQNGVKSYSPAGTAWMHNNGCAKRVKKEDVQLWIDLGWLLGRPTSE